MFGIYFTSLISIKKYHKTPQKDSTYEPAEYIEEVAPLLVEEYNRV